MIDRPGSDIIDTTVLQDGGTTYRLSKDNGGTRKGIFMEKTTAADWYKPETAWTEIQTNIGQAAYGNVEGPALFKDHDRNHWYLYVDVIPSTGYRPYETDNLDAGWTKVDTEQTPFTLSESTKHGGIVSLTKAEHERLVDSDVDELLTQDVALTTPAGTAPTLPATASVRLEDGTVTEVPVTWTAAPASTWATPGTRTVTGRVDAISNNLNQSSGNNLSGPPAVLSSTTMIDNEVTATVTVAASPVVPPVVVPPVVGPPVVVAPAPVATVSAPSRARAGSRPTVSLALSPAPAGAVAAVTVTRKAVKTVQGKKKRKTKTVLVSQVPVVGGVATLRLPRLKPGKHVVTTTYVGAGGLTTTDRTVIRVKAKRTRP
jgi:hypothetical protein